MDPETRTRGQVVTWWRGVIRQRLPQLFEPGQRPNGDAELVIDQLQEKIGAPTVEVDRLNVARMVALLEKGMMQHSQSK